MAVSEIISNSQSYADSWISRADSLVERLGDFSGHRWPEKIHVPNWDQLQPGSGTYTTNLLALLNGNAWTGDADIGKVTFEQPLMQ